MVSCEDALLLMSEALDGPLPLDRRQVLEEHLDGCPECRAAWEVLRPMTDALRDLGETPAPAELSTRVMDQIRAESGKTVPISRWKRAKWQRWAGLAACAALCVGLYCGASYRGSPAPAASGQAADSTFQTRALSPETGEDAGVSPAAAPYSLPEEDTAPRVNAALVTPPWGDGTALVLQSIPDALDGLLPPLETWNQEDDGARWCSVTAAELEAVQAALEEADAAFQLPDSPWTEPCAVVLLPSS